MRPRRKRSAIRGMRSSAALCRSCSSPKPAISSPRTWRELRNSEQRFRALFEQAAVGVAYIDTPTGKFLEVNHKCAQILGCAHADLLTLNFERLIHPMDLVRYE